jgi:hypothetical protein
LVERKPSKLDVAGSSPVSRFGSMGSGAGMASLRESGTTHSEGTARVAQLVEHTLGKGEVTGSIPVASLDGVHEAEYDQDTGQEERSSPDSFAVFESRTGCRGALLKICA